jgi:replicative DNA helicase
MEHKDPSLTKLPPQNLEAEQVTLASMLIDNKCILEVQKILSDGSFYSDAHRKIFSATVDAFGKQGSVDIVILNEELKQRNQLEQVGGSAYICNMIDNLASAANVAYYVKIIKQKALLRQVITGCIEFMTESYAGNVPMNEILGKIKIWETELTNRSTEEDDFDQKSAMTPEHLDEYFSSCRPTPWESLNNLIVGMFGKQLFVVAARGGMGKTALQLSLLRHAAITERRPSFFAGAQVTLEMVFTRLLSAETGVPFNLIRGRKVKDIEHVNALMAAHKMILEAPIKFHCTDIRINTVDLISRISRFIDENKGDVGLVSIENLQQLVWPGDKYRKDEKSYRLEELDIITQALKSFGMKTKIPIALSSQISRKAEDQEEKRPLLSHLQGSDKIEGIADVVLFPFRPEYYKKLQAPPEWERAELMVVKGGTIAYIPLDFSTKCFSWRETREN